MNSAKNPRRFGGLWSFAIFNPKGLRHSARGCRTRLPWEAEDVRRPTPNGVVARRRSQPSQGCNAIRRGSQGSRVQQPWAVGCNPVRGCLSTSPPFRSHAAESIHVSQTVCHKPPVHLFFEYTVKSRRKFSTVPDNRFKDAKHARRLCCRRVFSCYRFAARGAQSPPQLA